MLNGKKNTSWVVKPLVPWHVRRRLLRALVSGYSLEQRDCFVLTNQQTNNSGGNYDH